MLWADLQMVTRISSLLQNVDRQPFMSPSYVCRRSSPTVTASDDSIVITASAVAPLLPAGAGGSGSQTGGAPLQHLHHLSHSHGNGTGAAAGGAGPGPGSSAAGSPAIAPVGLPYQRLNASSASSIPAPGLVGGRGGRA